MGLQDEGVGREWGRRGWRHTDERMETLRKVAARSVVSYTFIMTSSLVLTFDKYGHVVLVVYDSYLITFAALYPTFFLPHFLPVSLLQSSIKIRWLQLRRKSGSPQVVDLIPCSSCPLVDGSSTKTLSTKLLLIVRPAPSAVDFYCTNGWMTAAFFLIHHLSHFSRKKYQMFPSFSKSASNLVIQ